MLTPASDSGGWDDLEAIDRAPGSGLTTHCRRLRGPSAAWNNHPGRPAPSLRYHPVSELRLIEPFLHLCTTPAFQAGRPLTRANTTPAPNQGHCRRNTGPQPGATAASRGCPHHRGFRARTTTAERSSAASSQPGQPESCPVSLIESPEGRRSRLWFFVSCPLLTEGAVHTPREKWSRSRVAGRSQHPYG